MDTTQGNEGTPGGPAEAAEPGGPGSELPPGPPAGQTYQTARRPLWRSRTDRWVAGVAGGLGQYFGIDTLIVRILFVGLSFVGGLGIILYLVAWIFVPEEGTDRAAGQDLIDRAKDAPPWLAIALIVIGGLIALNITMHFLGIWVRPAALWSVVLIGAGIWLYRRPDTAPPPPPAQPPETQPDAGSRAAGGVVTPSAYSSTIAPPASASSVARPPVPPTPAPWSHQAAAARRKRRSPLGRLTVAIGLVVIGVIAMLNNAGALTIAPRHFPAIALLIVGGGLLVGTLWGRSRGLVFLGLILVPFALTANAFNGSLRGGTGERTFTPASAAEAAGGYRLGAGQMRIDLSGMDWSQPVRLKATMGLGELDVTVPPDVRADVRSHVAAGSVVLFGVERSGTDVVFDTVDGSSSATKTLVLDTEVTFGQINVNRAGTPAIPDQPSDFDEPTAPATPGGSQQPDGGVQ